MTLLKINLSLSSKFIFFDCILKHGHTKLLGFLQGHGGTYMPFCHQLIL